jgi:hypothetical protein
MIRRLIGGTIFAVSLASAVLALAEGPMSPIRPSSPAAARIALPPVAAQVTPAASISPPAAQGGTDDAKKPVPEPAAVADIPPPIPVLKTDTPTPAAESKDGPKQDTVISTAPPAADSKGDKPEPRTAQRQKKPRSVHAIPRPRYRTYAVRYARPRYYWPAYRSSGWTGSSVPYTPGFGPAPYSASGN